MMCAHIRSSSGAASRTYVLQQPTMPVSFGALGPTSLLVTLGRSASLIRSNSNSSLGTATTPV